MKDLALRLAFPISFLIAAIVLMFLILRIELNSRFHKAKPKEKRTKSRYFEKLPAWNLN